MWQNKYDSKMFAIECLKSYSSQQVLAVIIENKYYY